MEQGRKSCCAPGRAVEEAEISNRTNRTGIARPKAGIRFPEKMNWIEGGRFLMGTNDTDGIQQDREGPVRECKVETFLLDRFAVTNEEFMHFVKETGYRTEAEKFGWSFVFYQLIPPHAALEVQQVAATPWWYAVGQAVWFRPEGPQSSISERMDHPVVHISWNDAQAFCRWAGKRLPTEIEWEYAARGGLEQKKYPWGDELAPDGKHRCNIWQGTFPTVNTEADGFLGTAPAQSFPVNGYGLFNMSGNVWEWCQDPFENNTQTGNAPRSMRGGSYLCHESYCNRYRVAARTSNTMDSSSGNIGFRCAAQ